MEALIVEALMGAVGGAIIGLIAFPSLLRIGKSKRTTQRRSTSIERPRRSSVRSARTLQPRTRKTRRVAVHSASLPAQPTIAPVSVSETFQACPSCGLQAPEELMREHFLGSPTHRNGKPPVTVEDDEVQWEGMGKLAKDPDPATLNLMRSLMHLLVPPRAFGLRGQERKGNPVESVVKRSSILENFQLQMVPVA